MTGNSQLNEKISSASPTDNSASQHDAVVILDECLGMSEASQLYSHLMKLASRGHDVTLDCSKVTFIDNTVLRMLVPFVWQMNKTNDSTVSWKHPSEAFRKSVDKLGFDSHLGMGTGAE